MWFKSSAQGQSFAEPLLPQTASCRYRPLVSAILHSGIRGWPALPNERRPTRKPSDCRTADKYPCPSQQRRITTEKTSRKMRREQVGTLFSAILESGAATTWLHLPVSIGKIAENRLDLS